MDGTHPLTFEILQKNKEWMEYLENKSIKSAILRNKFYKENLSKYFQQFGSKALKLGINRAETVSRMIENNNVYLMREWYDKTGCKFIPDIVIMQNFNITDADKFLLSGKTWSRLMKIKSFSSSVESREAMLKLAYSFGAFDNDQRGFKKLMDLLTGIPTKINSDKKHFMDKVINSNLNNIDNDIKKDLISALEKENAVINPNENLMSQIYKENETGGYTLMIDPQSCPNSAKIIRTILEKYNEFPILNADKVHKIFGGFKLDYNPEFREFLLENIDIILTNPDVGRYIPMIQKQFDKIKVANSNRKLTLDLAISYVNENKYTNVKLGNERVAAVSAIAGYSQLDFEELQKIFDYGKKRTFSSIPRINNSTEKYNYEILRLDDPLAMAIGTLTDCCQELNSAAEMCMEHSMVDKNGRVFVIRDKDGNIVAQSWVWRNKGVLCFDNIEVPNRAFTRAIKNNEEDREKFTDEIYDIYKKAAQELIEKDNDMYKQLLEAGKISKEEYEGLKLKKVTVGLGYNDIANSIKRNSKSDDEILSGPIPFEAPIKLHHGLYTNDSVTQYVLEKKEDYKYYDGDAMPVYSDNYEIYDNNNFPQKEIIFLNKLSLALKGYELLLDNAKDKNIVSTLGQNYGLNPQNTRIVMNSNFAILYEIGQDKIRIGELLYNDNQVDNEDTKINDYVSMQMYLAITQISEGKEIDISLLNKAQKARYMQVINIKDNIDKERGVGYAK